MTQAELADAADIHEKTIQNLLAGRAVRNQTLFDVCSAGPGFREGQGRRNGRGAAAPRCARAERRRESRASPAYMGAYTRAGVRLYRQLPDVAPVVLGAGRRDGLSCHIVWDDEWPSLLFQERDRPDKPYLHRGRLYIPAGSPFVHLVSLTKGAMRMVMVSSLGPSGEMRGLIATLNKQGAAFVPVSAPIVYVKRADFTGLELGEIAADRAAALGYRQHIEEITGQGYARLIG